MCGDGTLGGEMLCGVHRYLRYVPAQGFPKPKRREIFEEPRKHSLVLRSWRVLCLLQSTDRRCISIPDKRATCTNCHLRCGPNSTNLSWPDCLSAFGPLLFLVSGPQRYLAAQHHEQTSRQAENLPLLLVPASRVLHMYSRRRTSGGHLVRKFLYCGGNRDDGGSNQLSHLPHAARPFASLVMRLASPLGPALNGRP